MDAKTTTPVEQDEVTPGLSHEEEELSSGNGRLAIMVGIIVALVALGYVLLPAQATRHIARAMPIMELGEASVTGHREEAAPTTEEEAATEAEAAATEKGTSRPATATPEPAEATALAAPAATEAAPATVTLSGRILDEEGQPLAGATVMLKGSRKVAGTDANGNYSLEVPAGDNTLVYGYGGYEDHEVHARNGQVQNVTLVPREDAPRRRRR